MKLTTAQLRRIIRIKKKYGKYEYGMAQTDADVGFLLRMLTGKDPKVIKRYRE